MSKKKTGVLLILAMVLCLGMSMGVLAANDGWTTDGTYRYYYQDGKKLTKWQNIGGKRYYFTTKNGRMANGYYRIGKKTYEFKANGTYVREAKRAKWITDSTGVRYQTATGKYATGWKTIQFKRYHFSKKGYANEGWKKIKGNHYFFSKKASKRGVMQVNKKIKAGKTTYYVGADGKRVLNTWAGTDYYGADGKLIKNYIDQTRDNKDKTGWVGYGKYMKYYQNGVAVTGWKTVSGNRYFFKKNGYIKIGWHNDGKFHYYLSNDKNHYGKMMTGWMKINNKYYYFFTKKTKIGSTTYNKGTMARGMRISSGSTGKVYDFGQDGACTNYK